MNEGTSRPRPELQLRQETTSSSPSGSESGMELGLNSWFPAYGYHAPQLQLQIHSPAAAAAAAAATHYQQNFQPNNEDPRSNDALLVQQVEFLETILEETSDDLQSDSDRSGTAYWLGSDSETESVIHVRARHAEEKLDGSGSECNSVVPKKRRRKNVIEEDEDAVMMYGDNEEEDDDEDFSSSSRSSSLLQFETLERNCATTCRDSPSSYSFDSLDFSNRRNNQNFGNTSPDSLEGRSFMENENIGLTNGSSSLGRDNRSQLQVNGIGRIRPYRSFESLNTCQKSELDINRQKNGGFAIYLPPLEKTRGTDGYYDDDYDEYDNDEDEEDDDIDARISRRRISKTRDRDFWHSYDDEDDDSLAEFKNFEDRLSFGEIPSGYSTSLDCRNIIDLREIGIETKRDAVLDLRSGQTVTSGALMQSRINIASNLGRSGGGGGGGGGGCSTGQQGWSEQGFNFRFMDKSQSVPSLATDVFQDGVAVTRRCSISPSQLHFEAQDFENFVQVSSVPVGLNLCGLASQNAFRATSDSNDNKMADNCTEHENSTSSRSPSPNHEDQESQRETRGVTSTVRTQDRTETNLVLVPVPMTDHDVDSIVDQAIRQFKREVEEAAIHNEEEALGGGGEEEGEDEGSNTQKMLNQQQQQRPRGIKNNASYELAQQSQVNENLARRMPSFDETKDEIPKPTPRRRVRNNASYELAQQFDYVKAIAGQRPFHRMDACDELEEPGTSALKVTDLVEEMTKGHATGSAINLTTVNGFGPHDTRVYSKSTENVCDSRVNEENHVYNRGKTEQKKRTTIVEPDHSVFNQIKKNLDSFSTYGENVNDHEIDDLDIPYLENKPVVDHHHHHHHHHHQQHNNNNNNNNNNDHHHQNINNNNDNNKDQQFLPLEDLVTCEETVASVANEERREDEEDEEEEEEKEDEEEGRDKKRRLKVNVNIAQYNMNGAGSNSLMNDRFVVKTSLETSSSRSASSTPNLHKMSYIGEFYPEQNTSYVQSERDIRVTDDDPFIDDVDEGIGSVQDYDSRLYLHGSVRSESAIGGGVGMKCSGEIGNRKNLHGNGNGDNNNDDEIGLGESDNMMARASCSSSSRNMERRSRAGSSTTSGNTSLGEGSTASEWPPRSEADNVYPPLLTRAVEPLQRITSLKRSGTVEAKQTQSKTVVVQPPSCVESRDNKMSSTVQETITTMNQHHHQQSSPPGSNKISPEKKKGLGGFLQRFSRLRFSGRSKVPRSELLKKSDQTRPNNVKVTNKTVMMDKHNKEPDYVIIPLHGPTPDDVQPDHLVVVEPSNGTPNNHQQTTTKTNDVQRSGSNLSSNSRSGISSKPPLPPQPPRVGALSARPPSGVGTRRRAATDLGSPTAIEMAKARAMQAGSERPVGLLETDLDAADVADASVDHQVGVATPANSNKKTRSLLNLNHSRAVPGGRNVLNAPQSPGGTNVEGAVACGHQRPHKSMEFLLDKENLHFVKPPENELQKVGERVPSEHELRVQRSLQRLNVPDWYKNSPAARDGFRLKRHSDASQHGGWRTLGSKTTSLSSLSSSNKPPAGPLLSPSPTPPVFSRWSTSLLNSAGSSPASSARSSFNHRQPYLGWRSQERLSNPRTPAERLAQGILPNVPPTAKKQPTSFGPAQQLEVRNSIKEVTSAIVHYVQSGQEVNSGDCGRLSPRPDDWEDSRGGARSTSPRGSVKLCWMESSFVGIRPVDSPKTPMSLTTDVECCAVCNSTPNEPCTCVDSAASGLFLDLTPEGNQRMPSSPSSHHHNNHHHHHRYHRGSGSGHSDTEEAMAAAALLRNKPSPGSTTLEDVLDSLLGLPPASRTPSPGPGPTRRSTAAGKSCSTLRQDLQESASTMVLEASLQLEETTPASYFIQGGQNRRKSEGSDSLPPRNTSKSSSLRNRRVSFDNAQDTPTGILQQQQQQDKMMVRCRYGKCTNSATAGDARRSFKTCHNCSYAYCSRECRRAHWERHRRTCLHSRAGTLCRQVLSSAKKDGHSLQHISTLARRGYTSHGRGAVKCFFTSPESAEKFINNGFVALGEPTYVRWADLLPSEMGTELHAELMRLCKSYNPDTRLVLYVAVCVVSEVPTSGAVRWERQLVSRCAKIRLAGSNREPGTILVSTTTTTTATTTTMSGNSQQSQRQISPCNITREMDSPETLVLTSFPGTNGQNTPQRAREISFTNIQRQLRLRGVSLRRHFPQVYKKLCSYVDGSVDKFAPVTIYPRDQASGKSFMCIIMLDAEPERLQLLPTDSSRVRTVDISIEQE